MTIADTLNAQIMRIADQGFRDPLDDSAVINMALRLDQSFAFKYFEQCDEWFFEFTFSDSSSVCYSSILENDE